MSNGHNTTGTSRGTSGSGRRRVRSLGVLAGAAVVTTASVSLALGLMPAQADQSTAARSASTDPVPIQYAPNHTASAESTSIRSAAGETPPSHDEVGPSGASAAAVRAIGTSQLLQSGDLAAVSPKLDTANIALNWDEDFSSCLGEGNSWTETLRGARKAINVQWSSRKDPNLGLSESIGQAKTAAQAKGYAKTLIDKGIRGCQAGTSQWDFHYGKTHTVKVGTGVATWAASYTGSSTRADGGIVVVVNGTNFGIIQTNATAGSVDKAIASLAKSAVKRLG
ncbi:hypothetical protein [Kribbella solani]|uniref:hypothetical protein n=1 Tax=Kribbella solani TaxID=236067 RepID=UPI0029BC10BE|nr:hypothetical protein [Kribbella solani]MDX2973042.1 hypothetical protein [Kribbella solani]